jgi:hypothetical protein
MFSFIAVVHTQTPLQQTLKFLPNIISNAVLWHKAGTKNVPGQQAFSLEAEPAQSQPCAHPSSVPLLARLSQTGATSTPVS